MILTWLIPSLPLVLGSDVMPSAGLLSIALALTTL